MTVCKMSNVVQITTLEISFVYDYAMQIEFFYLMKLYIFYSVITFALFAFW